MLTVYIAAGVALALVLALLAAILRKLDGLPPRVWGIAQRERAREESTALEVLTDSTRTRVTAIVAGLRAYEEQVAAAWRDQVASGETRARIAERRAADVGVALSAATDLVREARELRDALELLMVRGRDRDRASPRLASPSVAPPGSASVLPSQPAIIAAGLGPKPQSGPVRRPTLLGIRPPPPPPVPDVSEGDRPSEEEEELTTVAPRPAGASPTAKTLLSMPAVATPAEEGGAS
jgi:hypothetical protein